MQTFMKKKFARKIYFQDIIWNTPKALSAFYKAQLCLISLFLKWKSLNKNFLISLSF